MPTAHDSPTPPGTPTVAVAVVGSANLDIVIELETAPRPGETVLGRSYSEHGGGKGQNQAIASAALVPTAFVGAVGQDAAGDALLANMRAYGVDISRAVRSELLSGRAFITLTPDAENSIVVVAGASSALDAKSVIAALDVLAPAVVIAQYEIASEAIVAASDWAVDNERRFVFNASPVAPITDAVLASADPLIVNANEAREILGRDAADAAGRASERDPEHSLAAQLTDLSASAIVTAGQRGAYVADRDSGVRHVPATVVDAVDTTGAGDAFAGAVAASLALGSTLESAARAGAAASARLVALRRGERRPPAALT